MSQHTRRSVLGIVVASAAAVSLGLSTAHAAPEPSRAVSDDTRRAAQELRAAAGQDAFSDLVARTLERYPEQVVDFSWGTDGGTLVVAPAVAAEVGAQVAAGRVAVAVAVEEAAPGAIPYLGRADVELAAIEQLRSAGAESLAARYDVESQSVVVTAWTDSRAATAERVDGLLARTSARTAAGPSIAVEYEPAQDAPQENTTQGGEVYGGCTGGFMATRGSAYGITTSAHCTTKPSRYDGDTTGSTYVASNNRDVRFTALSGDTPENKFRVNSSTLRAITSTGVVSTGAVLYKYGKTTGYGSSTVESYKGCVTFSSGNVWCNLYYTKDKVTSGGDSGGPWFVAYKGYGFTTGSNSGGSYITPVAWVGSISGTVKVKTS